jgi:hypothetical protein
MNLIVVSISFIGGHTVSGRFLPNASRNLVYLDPMDVFTVHHSTASVSILCSIASNLFQLNITSIG